MLLPYLEPGTPKDLDIQQHNIWNKTKGAYMHKKKVYSLKATNLNQQSNDRTPCNSHIFTLLMEMD